MLFGVVTRNRAILREAEEVSLGPKIDEKLFKVEARCARPRHRTFFY
jgi:hypothetical protein